MRRILEEAQDKKLLWEVLDAISLPAFSINDEFRITGLNGSACERLSFIKEELEGISIFDIVEMEHPPLSLAEKRTITEGHCRKKNREQFPARITFVKQEQGFFVIIEDRGDIKRLSARASLRNKEINTYNALSKALSRPAEPKETMKEVLKTLVRVMELDAAWLYLADENSRDLSLCSFEGIEEKVFEGARCLSPYECFIGRVLSSGKALLIKNATVDPRITRLRIRDTDVKSIAGVPLIVKEIGAGKARVVGVLGFASKTEDRFSSLDMQFFSAIGNQLGVAVENIRLIGKLRDKMRQIELINEISGVVNSSLTIGHIFRIAISEVKKLIHFDRASITLMDETGKRLSIFTLDTTLPTRLIKGVKAPIEKTSAGWASRNQKPWINTDLKTHIAFEYDSKLYDEGIRSTISIPLFKDRPLGSLNLDSLQPESYSEKDFEILLAVAKHLSIALENALLFEQISREKREWEKTFDSITDMVWIEDMKGNVLRANSAAADKTGIQESELVKKRSEDIFKSMQVEDPEPARSDSKRRHYREFRSSGGKILHFWRYPLVDNDGQVYGIVNTLKDVTEQKRLEQQLIRASKLASLGTLVAGIAHEINNPMGIIAGYSEALLDRAAQSELREVDAFEDFPEYLETINSEIFRCKDILKGLLDFARPSGGTIREIDINELIKEVILLVKHRAKKENQTISLDLERDIPKTAADPGALRQLFMNIIINSFYFTGPDGNIHVETRSEPDFYKQRVIRITISDNGKGIEKEVLERIFDPFFTTKPAGDGTGLGLSICHRIVSEHDGTIEAQSEPGKGTVFSIRFPVKRIGDL